LISRIDSSSPCSLAGGYGKPWNRFLGSLNVYKFGLRTETVASVYAKATERWHMSQSHRYMKRVSHRDIDVL